MQKSRVVKTAGLRGAPALPYKRAMAETTYFPPRLILAGAIVSGVLLALAVHMLGARYGLDLGGLWRKDTAEFMPAGAAVAWWLIATVGFSGGYFTANLMDSAVSGQIPQRMRQLLVAIGVLILADTADYLDWKKVKILPTGRGVAVPPEFAAGAIVEFITLQPS